MAYYEKSPARDRARSTPKRKRFPPTSLPGAARSLPKKRAPTPSTSPTAAKTTSRRNTPSGQDLSPPRDVTSPPWKKQADAIEIDEARDYVSDKGDEVWSILEARGIKNVILAGVHTNMCVLGRSLWPAADGQERPPRRPHAGHDGHHVQPPPPAGPTSATSRGPTASSNTSRSSSALRSPAIKSLADGLSASSMTAARVSPSSSPKTSTRRKSRSPVRPRSPRPRLRRHAPLRQRHRAERRSNLGLIDSADILPVKRAPPRPRPPRR